VEAFVRLLGLVAGLCMLLAGSIADAAPPLDIARAGQKRDASRAGTPFRMPHRAPGVDAAEEMRAGASGTFKCVVILLQFPDNPADTLDHTPAAFDSLLFSVGTHPTGSFRDYYREISRDQFDVEGVVTRWYTAPQPYSYYVDGQQGFGNFPNNSQGMVADAINLADPDIDFSQFDSNGPLGLPDGVVDGLFVVHAGPGGEQTGSVNDMWSHKFNLPAGVSKDGTTLFAFTTEPERWGPNGSPPLTPPGELISIGVFCHEFGHVLGLPDLYDLSGDVDDSEGVGEWDLMGSGVYTHVPANAAGSSPAHMSAWSKIQMGWVTPTWVLQDSAGVTIPPVETSGRVFRLWTNGEDAGEYFLAENRQPIGFDAGLVRSSIEAGDGPARGLVIYHVDGSILNNNNAAHKLLDVEEAGGPEFGSGFIGAQNLDVHRGATVAQTSCGQTAGVEGNRGDKYDPWPGPQGATSFDPGSCPSSRTYCDNRPSQVAIRNMVEVGGDLTADFFVNGVTVRHEAIPVDDSPLIGPPNNGNGLAEPGETVRLRLPLVNYAAVATGPLVARLQAESFMTIDPDSIVYPSIAGGASDSGSAILATILPTPDPRGVNLTFSIFAAPGLVDSDSVQVLVGTKRGICDNFENTLRRWVAVSGGCNGTNEWHLEAGVNHTQGGAWAWRLGPSGLIGSYAPSQDARLTSQPIRLAGVADTLTFWHRYDSEFANDGLTVEVSTDGAETWSTLIPVGGYSNGDKWTGFQASFTQAKVPLTGLTGLVQIGFRFRSNSSVGGLGWWIDDVTVTGDDECATTSVQVTRFDAAPVPGRAAVALEWRLADAIGATVGLDRSFGAEPRRRIATLPVEERDGAFEDADVLPGVTYSYWLTASRPGDLDAEAGPVLVTVSLSSGGNAPRALAMGRIRPNPFRPSAQFSVSLDRDGPYVVRVFRADGSLVRTFADSRGREGIVPFTWDGTDDRGKPAGAGIYLFQLRAQGRVRVQKAVLLR
jgi:immune inhibitor A